MEIWELGSVSLFILMTAVLVSASVRDWREREVSDAHWLILGIAGTAVFFAVAVIGHGFRWEYLCMLIGSAMILIDILSDRVGNVLIFYTVMAVLFAVGAYSGAGDPVITAWLSVPACYLVFSGMYYAGILRGGADAKCLMVLSMMFPVYPSFLSMPLIGVPDGIISSIFVYPVSVLFLAAFMSAASCLYFAVVNIRNGDVCRRMLSGYRMDLDEAEGSHVWPIEDAVDGGIVPSGIPVDGGEVFSRLRSAGCTRIWVTPMIPFVIPITVAAVLVAVIGNPLFLIG